MARRVVIIPDDAFNSDGSLDSAKVPDYIPALDQQGNVVGYVSKQDAVPSQPVGSPRTGERNKPVPVLDNSLSNVVGYMYPGRGYVPIGHAPEEVPRIAVTTVPR